VAAQALLAEHPHLATDHRLPTWAELGAAHRLIVSAQRLCQDIDAYRDAIAALFPNRPLPDGGDDIPF